MADFEIQTTTLYLFTEHIRHCVFPVLVPSVQNIECVLFLYDTPYFTTPYPSKLDKNKKVMYSIFVDMFL